MAELGTQERAVTPATATPAAGRSEPIVSVRNLAKHFRRESGAIVAAVDDVSLDVDAGDFVVLLGPSGCGKTTLLRTLAGLEVPDQGSISIRGRVTFDGARKINVPTEDRSISMIFQSYALWPHMTVAQNVSYPLTSRKVKLRKAGVTEAVDRALELVRIPDLAHQYPGQISGGQQQRVALARALVANSDLILFDEPLSNVDAQVRQQLRYELLEMQRDLGFAAVYVTHDQDEAMGLAHRIAVMDRGKIQQIASPQETYEKPNTRYVANFIGVSNEVPGEIVELDADGTGVLRTSLGDFTGVVRTPAMKPGDDATLVWRPEHAAITRDKPGGSSRFQAKVEAVIFAGAHREVLLAVGDHRMRAWSHVSSSIEPGTTVWVATDDAYNLILGS